MPGRSFTTADGYRFGFNGKETDTEYGAGGGTQDYGFRMYSPAVARFLSVDPLAPQYPWYTPYQFAGNKPINNIDIDGLEEYENYTAYKIHNGESALSSGQLSGHNGVWFTSDRVNRNDRWSNAMSYITCNQDIHKLTAGTVGVYAGETFQSSYSFKQVRDYYLWAQNQMDVFGYSSNWAKGAAYLVDELADTFESTDNKSFSVMTGAFVPELRGLMKDLNIGIADYALGKFNSVLNTEEGSNVTDWYNWDSDFVMEEQVTIAAPEIYKKYDGTIALNLMDMLSKKQLPVISKHYFPNFGLFGVDLTDSDSDYGALGRYNVAMYMIYPQRHQKENGTLTNKQEKQINKAKNSADAYYENNKIKQ